MLLVRTLYEQVLVLLKSAQVVVEFNQSHRQDEQTDIEARALRNTHIHQKPYYTHKVH